MADSGTFARGGKFRADLESRSVHDNTEWKLNEKLFAKICNTFGTPEIDLFASRLNAQLDRYCSWKPDPGAIAVDALAESWSDQYFYAFPPFNLIGKCLQKIELEQAEGLMVVPFWPTQPWFSKFTQLCKETPFILFSRDAVPTLSHPWRPQEQLPRNLRLLVGCVSAKQSDTSKYLTGQKDLLLRHGDRGPGNNIVPTLVTGIPIVVRGQKTLMHQI